VIGGLLLKILLKYIETHEDEVVELVSQQVRAWIRDLQTRNAA